MNAWRNIFEQSRVNNARYLGDRLPAHNWRWPSDTWFQSRLRYLRKVIATTEIAGSDVRNLPKRQRI